MCVCLDRPGGAAQANNIRILMPSSQSQYMLITLWLRTRLCVILRFRQHCLFHMIIVVFSRSAVSDSFASPWTVAHQAPLSMGILQARILEWVAIPLSRGSSWPRDGTLISCIGRRVLYHPSLGEPPREPLPYGSCYLLRLVRAAVEPLECTWAALLHTVNVKYTLDFKGFI